MEYETGSHDYSPSKEFRRVIHEGDEVAVLFLCSADAAHRKSDLMTSSPPKLPWAWRVYRTTRNRIFLRF